jgi:hypothetical protein
MKSEVRVPVLVAVKMDRATAVELRRRAKADDRTVSAFVRRILADAVRKDAKDADRHESAAS